MAAARELSIVRAALLVSFGAASLLGVALAVQKGWPLVGAAPVLALLLLLALAGALARRGAPLRWLFAVALLNALTVVPELALRLADYRGGPRMEFGFPDPKTLAWFARDPELFWKHDPSTPGINSLGFRGREIEMPAPAGVVRVVFLGDSCTAIGQPESYPMVVERLLNEEPRADGRRYEVVNLAVPGYSSHQGRVLAERYAERLGAALVFVFFGWNDHWQAYGATDAEKVLPASAGRTIALAEKSRLVQALQAVVGRLQPGGGPLDEVRVPRERYAENLAAILAAFRAAGTPAVLVTAPTSLYRLGVPAPLVEQGFVPRAEAAVERHRDYAELTRRVAAEQGAELLDLERRWDELGELPRLFLSDAIHFTPEGRRRIAEDVVQAARRVIDTGD